MKQETLESVKKRYMKAGTDTKPHISIHPSHLELLNEFLILLNTKYSDIIDETIITIVYSEVYSTTVFDIGNTTTENVYLQLKETVVTDNRRKSNPVTRSVYLTWLYTGCIFLENGTPIKLSNPKIRTTNFASGWIEDSLCNGVIAPS